MNHATVEICLAVTCIRISRYWREKAATVYTFSRGFLCSDVTAVGLNHFRGQAAALQRIEW